MSSAISLFGASIPPYRASYIITKLGALKTGDFADNEITGMPYMRPASLWLSSRNQRKPSFIMPLVQCRPDVCGSPLISNYSMSFDTDDRLKTTTGLAELCGTDKVFMIKILRMLSSLNFIEEVDVLTYSTPLLHRL